jgi:hypothetical protein
MFALRRKDTVMPDWQIVHTPANQTKRNIKMHHTHKTSLILVAAALMSASATIFGATSQAFATNQSQAVELCGKNPNCGLSRVKGGVSLWVDNGVGGDTEIWCPDGGGQCSIISRGGAIGNDVRGIVLGSLSHSVKTAAP